MATAQPVVIAVFTEHGQVDRAINELLTSGFSSEQIRYSGHEAATGGEGALGKIKSLISGQGTAGGVHNELVNLGVPEDDARFYQNEYNAGRYVVAVLANGRVEDATAILGRNGGYGAARRMPEREP